MYFCLFVTSCSICTTIVLDRSFTSKLFKTLHGSAIKEKAYLCSYSSTIRKQTKTGGESTNPDKDKNIMCCAVLRYQYQILRKQFQKKDLIKLAIYYRSSLHVLLSDYPIFAKRKYHITTSTYGTKLRKIVFPANCCCLCAFLPSHCWELWVARRVQDVHFEASPGQLVVPGEEILDGRDILVGERTEEKPLDQRGLAHEAVAHHHESKSFVHHSEEKVTSLKKGKGGKN